MSEQVVQFAEVGFFDSAEVEGQGEGIGIGGDGYGGHFQKFLLNVASAPASGAGASSRRLSRDASPYLVGIFPTKRHEADGSGFQETAAIEVTCDFCERIRGRSEAPGLEESVVADPRFLRATDGKKNVSVLMR